MASKITGGCLCGACRYSTHAAPLNVRACHCRRCQQATGSAFYVRAQVPLGSLEVHGPVGWYDGGTGVRRGFCTVCGSTLFSERKSADTIGLALGSLDDPGQFKPEAHIWVSSRQAWLQLDDGLPQYPEGLP